MSAPTTLYRFHIDLSDVDRGVYEQIDFRAARHPSENGPYLLTRALAFILNYQEGLAFSAQGLGDPETPALLVNELNGRCRLWIEIGTPSARKLHKAAKVAGEVKVYTYKDPWLVVREARAQEVHRADAITVVGFAPRFLEALGKDLGRNVRWSVLVNEGLLTVTVGAHSFETELRPLLLTAPDPE